LKNSKARATWKCIWTGTWWTGGYSPRSTWSSRARARRNCFYHPDEYNKVVILRRALTGVPPVEAMELMLGKLKKTGSNIEFLLGMAV